VAVAAQSSPDRLDVGQRAVGTARVLQQVADLGQPVLVAACQVEEPAYGVQLVLGRGAVDECGRA
jgi:hypothetical protein